jgi:hypothetical protein
MLCKKCGESFSQKVIIDGKEKALSNRTYCLNCHPFGVKGRLLTESLDPTSEKRICQICGREYDYSPKSSRNHTKDKCNSCLVNIRRFRLKIKEIEYLGGKCSVCGYDKCPDALSFHHKDPKEKDFGLSGKYCLSWDKLKRELDKCLLLCNNCHAELHWEMKKDKMEKLISNNNLVQKRINEIKNKSITRLTGNPNFVEVDGKPYIKCTTCSKLIEITPYNAKQKYCSQECVHRHTRTFEITKETLTDLVLNNSYVKIGEMFGVSGNAIKKRCQRLGIYRGELKSIPG